MKELKKKHSSRLVGGGETSSWAERTYSKAAVGRMGRQGSGLWTGQPYICVWINQEKQLGSETDHATQGSSEGK